MLLLTLLQQSPHLLKLVVVVPALPSSDRSTISSANRCCRLTVFDLLRVLVGTVTAFHGCSFGYDVIFGVAFAFDAVRHFGPCELCAPEHCSCSSSFFHFSSCCRKVNAIR